MKNSFSLYIETETLYIIFFLQQEKSLFSQWREYTTKLCLHSLCLREEQKGYSQVSVYRQRESLCSTFSLYKEHEANLHFLYREQKQTLCRFSFNPQRERLKMNRISSVYREDKERGSVYCSRL